MIVTVEPPGFSLVNFDAGRIAALAAEVGALVGVPDDVAVEIDVDEKSPFGKASGVVAGRSVTLSIEGGAFEDPQRLRQFSEDGARLVLGRLLYRVVDRLDPAFGGPPAGTPTPSAATPAGPASTAGGPGAATPSASATASATPPTGPSTSSGAVPASRGPTSSGSAPPRSGRGR